jgi:hypothetical protein
MTFENLCQAALLISASTHLQRDMGHLELALGIGFMV